ncbi:transposase [Streptomyces sp. 7N604]|uniref:transposase n=1 Tax=Streptomyces sp. 7N604 TaxID=3457415 RepID=UPI003FCF880D
MSLQPGGTAAGPGADHCGGVCGVPEGKPGDAGAEPARRGLRGRAICRCVRGAGCSGLSPGALSLVTVLQFAENLTDRQAAAMAVRAIDWKYAIGAELTDTGFDDGVLSRFRARLAEHGMERWSSTGSWSTARTPDWWRPGASSAPIRPM